LFYIVELITQLITVGKFTFGTKVRATRYFPKRNVEHTK